jgi:hypothetical protein
MILEGALMEFAFLDTGDYGGSTAWERLLADDEAPLAYFAEIEPWVLADRS